MADSTRLVAARDVMTADLSPDVVLLDLRDGVYYDVDDVGARIWTLLQTPIEIRGIVEAVIEEFDVEPARCQRDVHAFVRALVDHGLVYVCDDAR